MPGKLAARFKPSLARLQARLGALAAPLRARLGVWRQLARDQAGARLDSLEARERHALVALGLFLAALLFYLAVWAPVSRYVAQGQAERDRQLGLLQYFQATEAEARAQKGGKAASQSLLSEVSRSAQALGLNPSRIQPEGRDAVSVWFDQVAYTRLMRWLEQLADSRKIAVRQITLERQSVSGQVSARLVLRR